jgi:hypothetical protein
MSLFARFMEMLAGKKRPFTPKRPHLLCARTRDPIGVVHHRAPLKGQPDRRVPVLVYGTVWIDNARAYPIRGKRETERARRRGAPALSGGA